MDQTLELHHLGPDHAREVIAGLAPLLAFALDLADVKALPDELSEVDAANNDLAPRVALVEHDAMLSVLPLDRLGLDQRDIARVRVIEMAIPFEPATSVSRHRLDLMGRLAVFGHQKDRFDAA